MDSTTVVNVLTGDLPDEEHAAAMEQFWDTYPRLEPIREIISEVVSHRRSAAARHEAFVAEISARYHVERTAIWSWMTLPVLMTMTESEIQDKTKASSERSMEVTQAETAEISAAMRENFADVERCIRLLYWHVERESMAAKSRCA